MNKLLIVDDSSTMRKIMKRVLRQSELEVEGILEACNGLEALEQLTNHPDIVLVLSDLNMPQMGGVDLVKKVRERADTRALPVVMVTSEGSEELAQDALESGANAYVTRPFTPNSIRLALEPYC